MGKGLFVGGILLLVFGVIVSSISSATQNYASQQISQCNSLGGQLGQTFSTERQQNCQSAGVYRSASSGGVMLGWGTALIGVVLAGIGGIQLAKVSRVHRETYTEVRQHTADVNSGRMFCRWCGKLRPVQGAFCAECGKLTEARSASIKKCIHCSASMSDDSEFCANCGRKF